MRGGARGGSEIGFHTVGLKQKINNLKLMHWESNGWGKHSSHLSCLENSASVGGCCTCCWMAM